MTDLTSFNKTDLVDDHVAADVNKLIAASIRPEYANTETISATKTLADIDCQYQFLTASGADRTVKLSPNAVGNHPTIVYNSGASNNIVVQDSTATYTMATLASGEWLVFLPLNASGWVAWAPATERYKLSVTVASNNLTLALKHLDGTDPSTYRPIMFVINGVKRYVTAALSVTVNAGAASGSGTFNAGASELKTLAIDYFAYVSYRTASTAVVLGFGRIPYARLGSDFSATAANEKYGAWSTAPASTDDVINIGRFEATNSGSASYNWSVPTFTSVNLIHGTISETRKLSWTPTVTSTGGTPTSETLACVYKIIGNQIQYFPDVTVTNAGTATGSIILTPPMNSLTNAGSGGREIATTGKALSTAYAISVNKIFLSFYDATTCWVNNYEVITMLTGFLQ